MFNFLKKSTTQTNSTPSEGWFSRLRHGLSRTRHRLRDSLADLVLGKKIIDDELLEALETQLLQADVGLATTDKILSDITQQVKRHQLSDPAALSEALRQKLHQLLSPFSQPLVLRDDQPFVLLMIGVNGAGKTTSIAKIAHHFKQAGHSVMLAAGDTFRAAAVEQLQVWGERNQVPVIAQQTGADSASVAFDALQAAKARGVDLLITDTAGRLHTQEHLMNELKKIKRVMHKQDNQAPHEVMLVIDASMGQNALQQAKQFHDAIGITGITITKLDGTAKGGILLAIADTLQLPIRFIGVGENIDDLQPFDATIFVDALFAQPDGKDAT